MVPSRWVTSPTPLKGKRVLVLSEDDALSALVTGALGALGAVAEPVGSAGQALAALAARPFDAALLDLPVADAGAAALLEPLAAAKVPAVVVSGVFRGERAAAALRRLGARDHLDKPFTLEALLGAMALVLGAPAVAPAGEAPDEVTGSRPLIAAPAPAPALEPQPAPGGAGRAEVHAAMEGLAAPLPGAPALRPAPLVPPPPSGLLATARLTRVLAALHVGQASGALTLVRGPVKKILAFEGGAPVYAASNLAEERFGALCVRCDLVTAERLAALRATAPDRRTAELLLEAGVIDAARRAELLAGQIRAVAWSAFGWRDGEYRFQAGRAPSGRVPIRLDLGELILEGVRRTAALDELRAELPAAVHLAPTPAPAFELYALRLSAAEAHLLTLADGTKAVGDLVRLSDLSERDVLAFLQACRDLRILDEVERVLASTRRMGFM
jgi:CheY-like chemotaxis protein